MLKPTTKLGFAILCRACARAGIAKDGSASRIGWCDAFTISFGNP